MRLRKGVEEYLTWKSTHIAKGTVDKYRRTLDEFVGHMGGHLAIKSLNAWDVHQFLTQDRFQRLGNYTWNQHRQALQGFAKFAREEGWCQANLTARTSPKKVVEVQKPFLSARQMMQLLEVARNPRDRAAFAFVGNLAVRDLDMRACRIRQLDLDAGTVLMWNEKADAWRPKPVTAELDGELRSYLSWYARHVQDFYQLPLDGDWFLFPSATHHPTTSGTVWRLRPGRMWSKHAVNAVHHALREIGFDGAKGYNGWHLLRRSLADVYFVAKGQQAEPVRELLDHKSVSTTYTYLNRSRTRDEVEADLRGNSLLSRVVTEENVVPFREVGGNGASSGV